MEDSLKLPLGSKILIAIFLTSGFFHIFNPGVFEPLIPPFLGSKLFTNRNGPINSFE